MSEEELLIERDEYLAHGLHIGTKSTHVDMDKYIFRVKKNQLAVIDIDSTDQQIRSAAKFLAQYEPEDILVVGRKEESFLPIKKFVEATGADSITGRFMPGTLTNPTSDGFIEPEVVLVTDPEQDGQAITEATHSNIPVVAIADSGDALDNIDIAVPANNKSNKSLGLIYYLLAREMAEETGMDFDIELEEFKPEEEVEEDEE